MKINHKIRLAGIAPQSLVNGLGMRKVFFSQGCTKHCKECFNPETWNKEEGKWYEIDEIIEQLKDEAFYLDGVTFSGGDPLEQEENFVVLAREVKKLGLNIWVYTGYTFEQLIHLAKTNKDMNEILHLVDVIVDGPFVVELNQPNLKFRGSTNQRFIDVPKSIETNKIVELHF